MTSLDLSMGLCNYSFVQIFDGLLPSIHSDGRVRKYEPVLGIPSLFVNTVTATKL